MATMHVRIFHPTAVALVAATLLAGAAQTASAQWPFVYAWCARYSAALDAQRIRGSGQRDIRATNCYFTSYRECEAAVSGLGGYCYRSPYFGRGYAGRRLRQ